MIKCFVEREKNKAIQLEFTKVIYKGEPIGLEDIRKLSDGEEITVTHTVRKFDFDKRGDRESA